MVQSIAQKRKSESTYCWPPEVKPSPTPPPKNCGGVTPASVGTSKTIASVSPSETPACELSASSATSAAMRGVSRRPKSPPSRSKRRRLLPDDDLRWTDGAAIVTPDVAAPCRVSSSRMTKHSCSVIAPPSVHSSASPSTHAPE